MVGMESGMVTARRRAEIVRLLAQEGMVETASLVARFGVSPPTIRRDLGWLVSQGLARRVRGGALSTSHSALPLGAVPTRIGRAAAGLVQDGETVFIGPGRLAQAAARALAGRERLTVVTNGLAVARDVTEQTSHALILTGGQVERGNQGLVGYLAQAALTDLRADRVLLELNGASAVGGLTDDSLAQAELARQLIGLGGQVVVLVLPERVGCVAAAYIGPATDADVIVTAREADSAPLWDLTETGVQVLLA